MLVAVFLIEGGLIRHESVYIEKTPACWQYSLRKTREEGSRAEILCLGSSLTKFAVHPALLTRKTGRSSYNLGLYGGRAASSDFLLERVLASGGRPTAVVLDFHDGPISSPRPGGPNDDLWKNRRSIEELLSTSDWLDLSWQARDANFLADALLGIAVPSVRGRLEIRHELEDALANQAGISRIGLYTLYRNWNVNGGAQVMRCEPHTGAEETTAPASEIALDDWANHRLLEHYARRFLVLTRERGIRVYWLFPPLAASVLEVEERSGFEPRFERLARTLLAENPQLIVVDGRRSAYGPALFHDATHLNEAGMAAFSDDLGEIIAATLPNRESQQRWIEIREYRPRPLEPDLENLARSRLALRREPGLKRN